MGTKNSKQDESSKMALKKIDTSKPEALKVPTPDSNRGVALPSHDAYPQRYARHDLVDFSYHHLNHHSQHQTHGYGAYPAHIPLSSHGRFLSQARLPGDFIDYQPVNIKNVNDMYGIENFDGNRRRKAQFRTFRPDMSKFYDAQTGVSGGLSEKPTKSTLLQELLECPICMNRYENPHVLPCQHTFCASCLKVLKSTAPQPDSNTLQCPICRELHVLKNGLDDIPPNYTMKRLIELEALQAEKEAIASAAALAAAKLQQQQQQLVAPKSELSKHDFKYKTLQRPRPRYEEHSPPPLAKPNKTSHHRHPNQSYRDRDHCECSNKSSKFKIVLLCHSSALESLSESSSDDQDYKEKFRDEYGQCTTFTKISVYGTDHLESIKKIVEKKFGIPFKEQLLVYHDKVMRSDYKQLFQYSIRHLSRVHIFDRRDVKDNIHEIEDEEPYYVDTNFLKELAALNDKKDSLKRPTPEKQQTNTSNISTRRVRKINEL